MTYATGPEKTLTGIPGFDDITRGGLPSGRMTVLLGDAGAGKTVFSLQTLVNGAKRGEAGVFVAFEEDTGRIRRNAESFGWNLPELASARLLFLDAYLSPTATFTGDFDLGGVLAQVSSQAEAIGAQRIVFDGIDVLLSLLDDATAQRRELFRLFEWVSAHGYTCILTAKAEGPDPLAPPQYGALPYMGDCVVLLRHRMLEEVSVRSIRVLKYRGSGFSENQHPMVITRAGVEVASYVRQELRAAVSSERISTGVESLDAMLEGGYYRGSSILLTGSPGVAKTTLAATFANACCERGERVMFLSFDEPVGQIVRNAATVGIHLQRWIDQGLLDLDSRRSEECGVEEHLVEIRSRAEQFQPSAMIVDPVSALTKAGGAAAAVYGSLRLLDFAKTRGITFLCTSLHVGVDPLTEQSLLQVSTLADTWFHLSYHVRDGERNRALTVVKSRGMAHSNQVREIVLTRQGVTLADVYSAGGEVLMGTARWEKEEQERQRAARVAGEAIEHARQLAQAEAEIRSRMAALDAELVGLGRRKNSAEAAVLAAVSDQEKAQLGISARRRRSEDGGAPADPVRPR